MINELENKDWNDLHEDFGKWDYLNDKAYQQLWEEKGFSYQDAQEWITIGFEPDDYYWVKEWKSHFFTPAQIQTWRANGLGTDEDEFAAYCRAKQYSPKLVATDLAKYRAEYKNWEQIPKPAQEALDLLYPLSLRSQIEIIDISKKNLTGSLLIQDFTQVKKIDCGGDSYLKKCNQITNLTILNCPGLTNLYCQDNQLTSLDFLTNLNKEKLTRLDIWSNQLTGDLSIFSQFVNLKVLRLNNNHFSGTLEPLKNCKKLEKLAIVNTNIIPTWEHLPWEIQIIERGWSDEGKEFLEKYQELPSAQSFSHDLQLWRTNQPAYQNLKETLLKINPKLDIQNIVNQFEFFNVKTGSFQGDLNNLTFLFKKSNEDKHFLYKTIENLTNLIKTQKEKIVEAYTYFSSEKETLQELVKAHLDYSKVKQQKQNKEAVKLRKQRDKIRDELEENLSEEQMAEIEGIFTDCDELVHAELELEAKANIPLSIEFTKKGNINITYISNVNVQHGHAFLGQTTFGNNTNLSTNTITYQSEQAAHILQPSPKPDF